MKTIKAFTVFFTTLLIFCITVEGAVRTVSNNPNSPGQYTSLQTAIDSANSGDTLYVHGSATSYGNATVKKPLTLIGAGFNPAKEPSLFTRVDHLYLDDPSTTANGSRIIGFFIYNRIYDFYGAQNIEVSRNRINGTSVSYTIQMHTNSNNWLIYNNVISTQEVYINDASNVLIYNNIITNTHIENSDKGSVIISNNIFLETSGAALNSIENATLQNNIFHGGDPNCTNCTFTNNISYLSNNTSFDIGGANNGSGNQEATDPQFVNVPSGTYLYNDTMDFHLGSSSPGANAGTDGSDIGIYGGSAPLPDHHDPNYQNTPMPAIPQVIYMRVQDAIIFQNDTLKIDVKARTQQ